MLPPTEWITVKQPASSKVCTAAVAAMALGEHISYAQDRMTPSYHEGKAYYKTRELLGILGYHGILTGLTLISQDGKLSRDSDITYELTMSDIFAVIVVKSKNYVDFSHFVFWDGKHVRDPDPGVSVTTDLEDYVVQDVYPLCYLEEEDDKCLALSNDSQNED